MRPAPMHARGDYPGFRVCSRRGWDMAPLIPELAREDVCGVFDGELVAFRDGVRTSRRRRRSTI